MKNQEQFEKTLRSQPFQAVPAAWRSEILAAAVQAGTATRTPIRPPTRSGQGMLVALRNLLWPHPVAWGALVSIWLLVAGLNLSSKDAGLGLPSTATTQAQPPELRHLLIEQERLLAEMLGEPALPAEPADARPRSARHPNLAWV